MKGKEIEEKNINNDIFFNENSRKKKVWVSETNSRKNYTISFV